MRTVRIRILFQGTVSAAKNSVSSGIEALLWLGHRKYIKCGAENLAVDYGFETDSLNEGVARRIFKELLQKT